MDRDEKIWQWIDGNLSPDADKDIFFKAAALYQLTRIANSLDDLERIADDLDGCLDWDEGVKVIGKVDTFEQN